MKKMLVLLSFPLQTETREICPQCLPSLPQLLLNGLLGLESRLTVRQSLLSERMEISGPTMTRLGIPVSERDWLDRVGGHGFFVRILTLCRLSSWELIFQHGVCARTLYVDVQGIFENSCSCFDVCAMYSPFCCNLRMNSRI